MIYGRKKRKTAEECEIEKRDKRKKRRGSSAVMLTCIFVSMVMAAGSIGEAASRSGTVAVAECAVETAGRSVLAGYDRALKDRYCLFGYEYDESRIAEMVENLSAEGTGSFALTKSSISEITVEKSGYSLAQTDVIEQEIKEIMKYRLLSDAIEKITSSFDTVGTASNILETQEKNTEVLEETKEALRKQQEAAEAAAESAAGNGQSGESDDSEDGQSDDYIDFSEADSVHDMLKTLTETSDAQAENSGDTDSSKTERVLRNGKIKDVLPSVQAGVSETTALSGIVSPFSKIHEYFSVSQIESEIYIDGYIIDFFNEHTQEASSDSFFQNEIEYILYGNYSDKENYRHARRTTYLIRMAMNMLYIYSSPKMMQEVTALAESLTPGPLAALTQLLVITAWSAAESLNDVKNLEAGNKITLIKTQDSWKITLQSIASGELSDGMIQNDSSSGLAYSSYLRILLATESTDTKLYRIMDLIQINMKGSERSNFVLANLFTGFVTDVNLEKKSIFPGIPNASMRVRICHTY